MTDLPTKEPLSIRAGLTLQWKISSDDYPANDGWTLTYYLVKDGTHIVIPSADGGDGNHLVNVDAATTATYAPGLYSYFGIFAKDSEKYPLHSDERQIEIKPDYSAQTTGYDARRIVPRTATI